MDITPWRIPEFPPSTGSKANSNPTAQSCKAMENDGLGNNFFPRGQGYMKKIKIKIKYLQNKGANCDLSMKSISWVLFHQKLQHLQSETVVILSYRQEHRP